MRDAIVADLPVEVITKIFSLLPIEDRLRVLPLVSRSWRSLARLPDCFREVDAASWCEGRVLSIVSDATSEEFLLPSSGECSHPQDELVKHVLELGDGNLSVLRVSHCSVSSIEALSSRCDNLIHLEIRNQHKGSIDCALGEVVKRCRNLRHLTLNPLYYECAGMASVITNASLVAIADNCRDLEELDVSGCRGVTRSGLVAVARGCKRLRSLSVDHCIESADADLVATCLAENCPLLEKISFARCSVGERGVEALSQGCSLLRRVNLSCSQDLTRVWSSSVARLPNLTELIVAENRWFSDDHLKSLAAADCGRRLAAVDLRLTGVSDVGLVPFVDTCRALKAIDGSWCEIGDASMRAICECCKDLETLRMVLTSMTDDCLVGIAQNLRRLTSLHYVPRDHCRTLRNSGARIGTELVFRNCSRIRSLGFGVTDLEASPPPKQQPGANFHQQHVVVVGGMENAAPSGTSTTTSCPCCCASSSSSSSRRRVVQMAASTATNLAGRNCRSHSPPANTSGACQQGGALDRREEGLASVVRCTAAEGLRDDDVNARYNRSAGPNTGFYSYTLFRAVAQLGSVLEEVLLRGPLVGGGFVDLNGQLCSFARRCPNVKAVAFHALPSLTDETVVALAAAWPLLERADFVDCQQVTSASLKALAFRCRSFRWLRIQNCRGVGSRVLYGDLRRGLPSSREVFLSANGTVYS
ncbi:hypothetical protein CBR_g10791 [Chara braunii]|uniref:F-box domain-containing protein n=1 Tax=Chara braunii TaxID=69332 RepID=A0A388KPI4_CHABU|nr:hypothetical protein CBR_g10791 [Chara braunii]|eukprot:GBG71853.1 hypothetical protein CBR_g10791 [Chara braunii]